MAAKPQALLLFVGVLAAIGFAVTFLSRPLTVFGALVALTVLGWLLVRAQTRTQQAGRRSRPQRKGKGQERPLRWKRRARSDIPFRVIEGYKDKDKRERRMQ
ncbi:hypothetical protein [Calditerricola satsumensis]|uniref:Uncharacterized protein n=1 Tax=Calditerricola satsumensis TaxID=373054 RepID=A0A8J3FCU7_9BACI|nr:hypothetical protein [Calditerricola satsumensis]GGJ93292.1 hypothetical protein GCM10007043_03750 [Calditerricola satsumensis]